MVNRKGQMTFEAGLILTLVIVSLVAMQGLIRAFIMGGWFNSTKQLGDPYNPPGTTGTISHSMTSNTLTNVNSIVNETSSYSLRIDTGTENSLEGGALTVNP